MNSSQMFGTSKGEPSRSNVWKNDISQRTIILFQIDHISPTWISFKKRVILNLNSTVPFWVCPWEKVTIS